MYESLRQCLRNEPFFTISYSIAQMQDQRVQGYSCLLTFKSVSGSNVSWIIKSQWLLCKDIKQNKLSTPLKGSIYLWFILLLTILQCRGSMNVPHLSLAENHVDAKKERLVAEKPLILEWKYCCAWQTLANWFVCWLLKLDFSAVYRE